MSGDASILVVDDVPGNLRLLEAVLAPRGYSVVTATNGRAALELVARRRAHASARLPADSETLYLSR